MIILCLVCLKTHLVLRLASNPHHGSYCTSQRYALRSKSGGVVLFGWTGVSSFPSEYWYRCSFLWRQRLCSFSRWALLRATAAERWKQNTTSLDKSSEMRNTKLSTPSSPFIALLCTQSKPCSLSWNLLFCLYGIMCVCCDRLSFLRAFLNRQEVGWGGGWDNKTHFPKKSFFHDWGPTE